MRRDGGSLALGRGYLLIRHRGCVFRGENVGQAAQVPLAFGARTLYLLGGGEKEKNRFLYVVRGKKYVEQNEQLKS